MANTGPSSVLQYLFILGVIFSSVFSASGTIIYADSLLMDGPMSRPHQIFTDSELRYYDLPTYGSETYWIVNAANLEEELLEDNEFWGLLYNDFYRYYDKADINVSTELKKKIFEKSELYTEFKDDMNFTRNILIADTIHMPLRDFFNYAREYDINRGGFLVQEELYGELPPFKQKEHSASNSRSRTLTVDIIGRPRSVGSRYPKYFVIPDNLKSKIDISNDRKFKFFIPIKKEEIAVQIEDMNGPYDNSFELLIQFHYVDKSEPYIELVDILLLDNKNNRILWTLAKGDMSDIN